MDLVGCAGPVAPFRFLPFAQQTAFLLVATGLVGVALVIWIGVEILMIGYQAQPPLQLIYGTVGVVMLILLLLASVKGYCSNTIAQAETDRS
jgi:membrane protein implicated in regulation of membrane protease activity